MNLKRIGIVAFVCACLWALISALSPVPDPAPREADETPKVPLDFDAFPTRRSLFQYGALLRAVLTGEPYVEADLGRPRIRPRPMIAVISLRLKGRQDRWVQAAASPDELLKKVEALSVRPEIVRALEMGGRVAVDLAVRTLEPQATALDRGVTLRGDEGLSLGEEVFEPRRLLESGCLSQSGEVRAEALAGVFPVEDPRRSALLKGQMLPWVRLTFRSLWLDSRGVHFDDEPLLLDAAHVGAAAMKMQAWLGRLAEDGFLVTRVDPQAEGTMRSAHTGLDISRVEAAATCGPFAARLSALQEAVRARQVGADGFVHEGAKIPPDLQCRAAAAGLIRELPVAVIKEAGVEARLALAFARRDRSLVPPIRLDRWDPTDHDVQAHLPWILWAEPENLGDFMALMRPSLVRRQAAIIDSTDRLLTQLEALRLVEERSFDEEAFLMAGTRELLQRVLHGGEAAANPDWGEGGLRSGRLSPALDPVRALRALEFLDWMSVSLEADPLPEVEGLVWQGESVAGAIIHESGMRLTVNLSPERAVQVQGVSGHAQPRWRHSPLWVSCDAAVLAEASVRAEPNVHPIATSERLSRGVLAESVGGHLRIRVLTRHGELALVAGAPAAGAVFHPWIRVLDLENPSSLLSLFVEHAWEGHLALKLP